MLCDTALWQEMLCDALLIHLPAECKSLTVDARFAPFIGRYIGLPAKFSRLFCQHCYAPLPTLSANALLAALTRTRSPHGFLVISNEFVPFSSRFVRPRSGVASMSTAWQVN